MITMTDKAKLEYIWLDGFKPTQSMRSKTMIRSDFGGTVGECPMWSFDDPPHFKQMEAIPIAY